MKKILKMYVFYILMMFMFMQSVFAESNVYYTNNAGVKMTESEYNYLLEHFNSRFIANFTQELFDSAMQDVSNVELLGSETIYIQTTTVTGPLGIVTSEDIILTKEEYENFEPIVPRTSCSYGSACWETNAKILYMTYERFTDSNGTANLAVVAMLDWKTTPNVKSYDVFAARYTDSNGGASFDKVIGAQYTNDITYTYNNNTANTKLASNGVGISMNMVDDFYHDWKTEYGAEFDMALYFTLTKNTTLNTWITYQHAISNVTLSQSQDYTFGSSGLGGVLNYNSTSIKNKYDGMQGLNMAFALFV